MQMLTHLTIVLIELASNKINSTVIVQCFNVLEDGTNFSFNLLDIF